MKHYSFAGLFALCGALLATQLHAQTNGWQQRTMYEMEVDMNVNTNRYTGTQVLTYTNNSPDTLTHLFYHLYYNAFQPNSMMDVRSRTISDPDGRVRDRISKLSEEEIGFLRVKSLKMGGKTIAFEENETILEVPLATPILPKATVKLDMEFEGQIPLQVRRSGRDSEEGVRYSMSQWFPKLCEYDYEGWHSNPYIGREFHGVWGDFDVKITIDSAYTVGGTGYLQNAQQIGHGYEKPGSKVNRPKGDKLTWHFKAPNVHDFMWAADPEYVHYTTQVPNGGPTLHFLYKDDPTIADNWQQLGSYTARAFTYMNTHFGRYPYEQFSTIQGGDGGMEYAMSTLITGRRSLRSLVGVTVHELVHSWFQGALATNEALYAWMDEGFTSYATALVMNELFPSNDPNNNIFAGSYSSYYNLVKSGLEEPMTSHADHYATNRAYSIAAYSKGAIALHQLGYVIGNDVLMRGMRRYFYTWRFKHPTVADFKRVMEKESGLELDWYFEHWVNTTNTIDYGVGELLPQGDETLVTLHRHGNMMMPVELFVLYKDGSLEMFYIPLAIMRGEKKPENDVKRTVMEDWPWVNPTYTFAVPAKMDDIAAFVIDPSQRMADVEQGNNAKEVAAPTRVFAPKK